MTLQRADEAGSVAADWAKSMVAKRPFALSHSGSNAKSEGHSRAMTNRSSLEQSDPMFLLKLDHHQSRANDHGRNIQCSCHIASDDGNGCAFLRPRRDNIVIKNESSNFIRFRCIRHSATVRCSLIAKLQTTRKRHGRRLPRRSAFSRPTGSLQLAL